ncbi:S-layer homology domain-containing protein [Oscillatoria salina]|uniref:S-layer homology domain-containing protein n=1 Tax=Oscillatoria salina TaxID=331517 RepID=UPI0013B824DF|nr:S-layer homology domain-containing protein [Oscillatoria salina]MBZ8179683.1 S-layer homology domain-containing protein [Oscillatoria salina IIICB1]NET87215.1 S-layer homology domain-containing protein [Kamptonema sp. SIO1D9]
MNNILHYLSASAVMLAIAMGFCTIDISETSAQDSPEVGFPDVTADYWANPFIQVLAEQDIIVGYPDGTFRPTENVDRDEFAAMIRQAFNQEQIKKIPSGSVFNDVPADYWAAPPIEEAYETGFLKGYPEQMFLPKQEITRVEALVSLTNGLDINYDQPISTETFATPEQTALEIETAPKKRRVIKNRLAFPLAFTALMQPILSIPKAVAQPVQTEPETIAAAGQTRTPGATAADIIQFYEDADQIPEYAIDDVAAATKSNIVVNYPEPQFLNPNEFLNRGAAAALIHQAMVYQGKLQPLEANVNAAEYIITDTSQTE